jgi:phage tail-like protein
LADLPVSSSGTNGYHPSVSSYLQYLPTPFQLDPFLGRFLLIFESILGPIEETVDNIPHYLDPGTTPLEMLPWLASWLDTELDENWPPEKCRELLRWTALLFRWRGTRRAMREHLRIYIGRPPLIVENFDGLRLGQDGAMGINSRLGDILECSIAVTVVADEPESLDEQVLRSIIESEKPAHVGYLLDIQPAG